MEHDSGEQLRSLIEHESRAFEAAYASRDARGLVESYFLEDSLARVASPPGGVVLALRGRRLARKGRLFCGRRMVELYRLREASTDPRSLLIT